MKVFVVAVMIDDVSVWTLLFCAGRGGNDGRGVKWGGGENWDRGKVQGLFRYVTCGVNKMDTGRLYEGREWDKSAV